MKKKIKKLPLNSEGIPSRNELSLSSFAGYCIENPDQRFFQALTNWVVLNKLADGVYFMNKQCKACEGIEYGMCPCGWENFPPKKSKPDDWNKTLKGMSESITQEPMELEEALYFDVMEDFLHCVEWAVRYEVKDKEKYYKELREYYEKLKQVVGNQIKQAEERVRSDIVKAVMKMKTYGYENKLVLRENLIKLINQNNE